MKKAAVAFITLVAAASTTARTITVDDNAPADFNNIQAAIDDSNDGDTVLVADGTYTGDGNRDIDIRGKAITVKSENGPGTCVIDCQGGFEDNHRGFYFHSGEDANSVLDGFTITNGDMLNGGGIYCDNSSPVVAHCIFDENYTESDGAGLYGTNSILTLTNCIFSRNGAGMFGGGIYYINGCPTVTNSTFTNNSAHWGGGIFCDTGMGTITGNTFTGNHADYGGGICCRYGATPVISNCTISGNSGDGGGILSWSSHPIITNNIIVGNHTSHYGGGINCHGAATIRNTVIANNHARFEGAGIHWWSSEAQSAVTSCIIWGNTAEESTGQAAQIYGIYPNYSCIEGWMVTSCGIGNIETDPRFADPGYWADPQNTPGYHWDDFWFDGDYHLKSQAGRWDVNEGGWTIDDVTSPCIDAGDPMSPIGNEPFPNGARINMGAYGGTAEASKSYFGAAPCGTIVAGDVNGDCEINFEDFRLMALHWCEEWE